MAEFICCCCLKKKSKWQKNAENLEIVVAEKNENGNNKTKTKITRNVTDSQHVQNSDKVSSSDV